MRAAIPGSILLLALSTAPCFADSVDPSTVRFGDVGPVTPFGETPAEAAAKKVAFEWVQMNMVLRKPQEAFEKYVSRDYCNHGHLSTGGQRDCAGYQETYDRWVKNWSVPVKPGEKIELPVMATVNGEMVTMFGEGVDIFRVHDGKLTDHWDASPPAEYTARQEQPGTPTGIVIDTVHLTAIDPGPTTPYGETLKEMANKRLVFAWNYLAMVQGKPQEAAGKYLSADFCDHSHMVTKGRKDCGSVAELLASPLGKAQPAKLGDRVEMPYMATVDGEMVTMYGAGIDVFRVHDGHITDHWDASPPRPTTIPAHNPDMVERMIKVVAGELPVGAGPPAAIVPASQGEPAAKP